MSNPYSRSKIRRVSWARTKRVIDLASRLQRVLDRLFGDLVKDQAVDWHFRFQQFLQMPADRFSLAVFVRREIQIVGLFEGVLELLDLLLFVVGNDVKRLEIVIDVDSQIGPRLALVLLRNVLFSGRKVADVTDTRLDLVARAEILRDRACFCR